MLEKYGVVQPQADEVRLVSGKHKGKIGIVKQANDPTKVVVELPSGEMVEVTTDEMEIVK